MSESDNEYIKLTITSIATVSNICKIVEKRNPKNAKTSSLASGIADYVQQRKRLSERQAKWVCHNADYCNLERPEELRNFSIAGKGAMLPAPEAGGTRMEPSKELVTLMQQLLQITANIEQKLTTALNAT